LKKKLCLFGLIWHSDSREICTTTLTNVNILTGVSCVLWNKLTNCSTKCVSCKYLFGICKVAIFVYASVAFWLFVWGGGGLWQSCDKVMSGRAT
jgi:hypothetical protein